jgi:hypothetical protein
MLVDGGKLRPGIMVVEYLTHDLKIESLNPTTGTGRKKILTKLKCL